LAEKSVAVVGSGIGGIAAAIRAAAKGYKVTVFEQGQTPGGKISEIKAGGFRFDTGPSLLTMPKMLEELYEIAGEKMEAYLQIMRLEVICKYFYPDGKTLVSFGDPGQFAREADAGMPGQGKQVLDYLDQSKRLFELTADLFIFSPFGRLKDFLNARYIYVGKHFFKMGFFSTLHRANQKQFDDIHLVRFLIVMQPTMAQIPTKHLPP